ncbi:Uncharacterized protein BM_BM12809 [Brugia malayi]|uniref:Bm12809, isoform b n=1 Tax=Brugia malayi TaxID=6279 RepID=A0A4E9FKL9_BRUMA|nr:Uncharacterized protein BM_BM12809 [Brugia malayi]VIO96018.1 Uncharacterized protein BM_BM12809 [Brugia malayi]
MLMYRRQIEHSRRLSRRGVVPVLERRTVWRDRSLSPAAERDQYVTKNTLSYHQNRFERRENFMMKESSSPRGHQRHRHRERLNSNSELSRQATRIASVRTGPMKSREYLERELAKHYRVRDRMIALERARNEENRLHDETNRNASRIQPSGYGSGRMPSYFVQTESQLVTEEISGKINNSGLANWRIEDLLGGQSVLNADNIQNAQTWIANDNSLSPAQVVRARELLQELLITITTKPNGPIAEDRSLNFITDCRVSDYSSPRSFSQQNTESALRSDTAVHGRELPVMQNSLPVDLPLSLPQNWRDDSLAAYSDAGEMPMSSRNMSEISDFRCGSRIDYPTPYTEDAEFGKRNAREHYPIHLGSERRRSYYHDRRQISRSRSRSLGKDYDTRIGERRVHMKSGGFISVGINHPQKGSRKTYLSYETRNNHHRGVKGERSLRRSSPRLVAKRRCKR